MTAFNLPYNLYMNVSSKFIEIKALYKIYILFRFKRMGFSHDT